MTVLGTRLTRQIIYVIGLANTITGVNNSQDLQDLFEKVKFLKQKIIKISFHKFTLYHCGIVKKL